MAFPDALYAAIHKDCGGTSYRSPRRYLQALASTVAYMCQYSHMQQLSQSIISPADHGADTRPRWEGMFNSEDTALSHFGPAVHALVWPLNPVVLPVLGQRRCVTLENLGSTSVT